MNRDQTWDYLLENGYATEEELRLVTSINGHNLETLNDILFVRTGYHDVEQIEGMED